MTGMTANPPSPPSPREGEGESRLRRGREDLTPRAPLPYEGRGEPGQPAPEAPAPYGGRGLGEGVHQPSVPPEAPAPYGGGGLGEGVYRPSRPPASPLPHIGERAPAPLLDGAGLLALQRHAASLPVASYVRDYAVRLILATRPDQRSAPGLVRRYVRYGASPRALQALEAAARAHALLEGRYNVAFQDVRRVAPAVLRHRVRLNVEADVRAVDAESVVAAVLAAVGEERPRRWAFGGRAAWPGLPLLIRRWRGRLA
ncbi:MAG TPA: hypothetical protein VII06_03030 [Chloroflexota bacterium]